MTSLIPNSTIWKPNSGRGDGPVSNRRKASATVWSYSHPASADELCHYASPYYDPVKAHEYYMRTREPKGKNSTAGLNEKGKEAATYVKEQISSEQKQKAENLKTERGTTLSTHKAEMQREIASLRAKLKGMSKEERAKNKTAVRREIDSLRRKNQAERQRLIAKYNAEGKTLSKTYADKYASELEAIGSDSSFRKKTGGKSK